jgi:hypothetical protein
LHKFVSNDEERKVAYSAPKVGTELADDEQNLITVEVYGPDLVHPFLTDAPFYPQQSLKSLTLWVECFLNRKLGAKVKPQRVESVGGPPRSILSEDIAMRTVLKKYEKLYMKVTGDAPQKDDDDQENDAPRCDKRYPSALQNAPSHVCSYFCEDAVEGS